MVVALSARPLQMEINRLATLFDGCALP